MNEEKLTESRLIRLLKKYDPILAPAYENKYEPEPSKYLGIGCTGDYPSKKIDIEYWDNVIKAEDNED